MLGLGASLNRTGAIESFVGLLNTYSGAAAAYSLRLLDNTYTGDAIVVRRASDNTTQAIGFVNNELDTATLESFCSGTDGFVTTWYDQSGNGNDAANTTYNGSTEAFDLLNENGLTVRQGKAVANHTYTITIVIDSVTSGGVRVYAGGTQSDVISTAGTHTFNITAGSSNNFLGLNPSGLATLSVSSFYAVDTTADGFVTTWYDQSGNNRNVTKTTAASQPQIVSSGSTITDNGKPAIEFSTAHDVKLQYTESQLLVSGDSLFVAAYNPSTTANYNVFDSAENDKFFLQNSSGDYKFDNQVSTYSLSEVPATNQILALLDFNGTTLKSYFDGSNTSTHTGVSSLYPRDGITIGGHRNNDGSNGFIGKFQELVYYDTNNSANVSGIQSNINSYYNIYP